MKRSFSLRNTLLVAGGTALIAATYGLVRLAYGLFLPDVERDLGLDTTAAGWVSSGASVLYCVGALVGFLAARTHPRTLVAVAACTAGIGATAMAASPDAVVFGASAVVGSTGAGLASPALVALIDQQVPDGRRGRAQAIVNSGTGPGLAVAGVLALVLLPDWRTAWAVSGAVALATGAAVLLAGRRGDPSPAAGDRPDGHWFRQHAAVLVLATAFGAGSAAVWTYGRAALVDAGTPAALSVVAWIALGLGGACVAVTAPWTTRLSARTAWGVTTAAVALAVAALGLVPAVTLLALVACAVFGWGYTAATGALIAWTTEIDPERAASGTSMLFVTLVLGQAVGSAGAGALVGGVGTGGTLVVAAVVVALTVSPLLLDPVTGSRRIAVPGHHRDAA